MKTDKAIRDAYAEHQAINSLIKREVDSLRGNFDARWHYESRLKSEESFALKVESGRVLEGFKIDDFFACTFVVRNSTEISAATEAVSRTFKIESRRPENLAVAAGRPSEFQFDDLRLYAKLKPSFRGHEPINDVLFEIQIKTFLQHAWGIATHDLTYKTDEVSWAKLRVAYQIKAMLEHAELSIEQFSNLAGSDIIAKGHSEYEALDKIISTFTSLWDRSALPKDMQRLAQAVKSAADLLNVGVDSSIGYLRADTEKGQGAKNLDLSPFVVTVSSMLSNHKIDVPAVLTAAKRRRRVSKIMLPRAVQIPSYLEPLRDKLIVSY
ncbi:hypothetical protein [Rhizobium sp. CAU 1783]